MLICPWLPNFSASPQFCCWTSHKKCHYIHYIKNLQLWRLKPPTTLFGFVWKYCTAKLVLHGLLSLTPMKFAVLGFREPSDSWVHSHSIWFVPTLFMNHQVLSHVQRPVLHAMTPFFAMTPGPLQAFWTCRAYGGMAQSTFSWKNHGPKWTNNSCFFWKPIHVLVLVVVVVAADSAIPIWPGKAATYEAMKRQRLFQTGGHAW